MLHISSKLNKHTDASGLDIKRDNTDLQKDVKRDNTDLHKDIKSDHTDL